MTGSFMNAVKSRRSVYSISKETVVSDERLEELIGTALKHVPSAFNSQSARVVVLLGREHDALWNIVEDTLKPLVPVNAWEATESKVASFRNGYGTVMFFEDSEVVEALQAQFPLYSENFPVWSQHSSGMLQFTVWTALELAGYGASLQHYGSLIEGVVKTKWGVPGNWRLIAQMPFGKPTADPGEKSYLPLEGRLRVVK